jgi:MYXO-CTERM domain-containing protein
VLAGVIAFGVSVGASPAYAAPWDKPGWELTFQDEFDGTAVDLGRWKPRYKWGEAIINSELQAYVDDAFVVQDGILSIVAKHESGQYAGQTLEYRSGVICSLHEQTYGYFEARVKVPKGQGYWPAFWLLGAVGTPNVNEIDILELLGHQTNTAYMTVHWGESYGAGHESDGSSFVGPDFSEGFHVFAVEWDESAIRWSIDGLERFTHSGDGVADVPMYLILNLAVGGGWPGAPDSTTVFPGSFQIDYVRAYRKASTDGGSGGSGGGAGASAGGGAGADVSGGATSSGGHAGAAPSSGGTSSGGSSAKPGAEDSGCGCRVARQQELSPIWIGVLLGLGLGGLRRRARRRAS